MRGFGYKPVSRKTAEETTQDVRNAKNKIVAGASKVGDFLIDDYGGAVNKTVRRFGRVIKRGAEKVMAPTVRAMKNEEAKMDKMKENALAGKFNR